MTLTGGKNGRPRRRWRSVTFNDRRRDTVGDSMEIRKETKTFFTTEDGKPFATRAEAEKYASDVTDKKILDDFIDGFISWNDDYWDISIQDLRSEWPNLTAAIRRHGHLKVYVVSSGECNGGGRQAQ